MTGDKEGFDLDTAIFTKAVEVFGSKEEAELWLRRPALALNGERPIDLLKTPQGTQLVQELLVRLEYGIYI
jgi:putative toxin-antitoxin system antitoxin component (TIGR02293 family)